jgi:hypothetical protein
MLSITKISETDPNCTIITWPSIIILFLTTYAIVFSLFLMESTRMFFTSQPLLWITAICSLTSNVYSYIQDPTRFTSGKKCFYIPCYIFALICAIGTSCFDMLLLWDLLDGLPVILKVILCVLIVGLVHSFIIYNFIKTPTVSTTDLSNPLPPQTGITAFFSKNGRIAIFYLTVIVGSLLFFQSYTSGVREDGLFHGFSSRFGGWSENKIMYIVGWILLIVAPILDFNGIYGASTYCAKDNNLPNTYQ